MKEIKFIDLFSGMGGIRIGFEQALKENNYISKCVFTSEIKKSAIEVLNKNFSHNIFNNDITKVQENDIPDFDYLLAGFPCQAFSYAGNRDGFADIRGTLFFDIERILKEKKPTGFILENVEGLVSHDKGRTLKTIISKLENLSYKVSWEVLDSKDFELAQSRRRIYIVGSVNKKPDINFMFQFNKPVNFIDIQEVGLKTEDSSFSKKLFSHFKPEELYGKAIKDKRGGNNNIHSWDFELKGSINRIQKNILNKLFKERRKKHWAEKIGIEWMDGMPLTLEQISEFCKIENLKELLDDLVSKGYLKFEYPKDKISIKNNDGKVIFRRVFNEDKPKG
ncbi:DNA-methyltransferase Dcm [Thiovulum sp. ES]|nr:DNA-methyltransferase Dcm [Thiovulum sp. ES]